MLVRSPTNNFETVDLTAAVRNIPIQYGSFNTMGIFEEEGVAGDVVMFEETTTDGAVLVDMVRGTKPTVGKDGTRKLHTFPVVHYPHDEFITPKDLKGISAYTNMNEVEKLESVRMAKLKRARMMQDWTLNKARAQALFSATAYAPNGTVVQDWNSEFGITRTAVNFDLTNSAVEVLDKIELVIQAVHDGMGGDGVFQGIVIPCDSGFFNKLIRHPSVTNAWKYAQANTAGKDPIRGRLAAGMANGRTFDFGNVVFVETRDSYNGAALATANEGVAVPVGSGRFKTFFGSPERFGLVNTAGEQMYAFETANQKGTEIEIETESNSISALLRPQAVIRCY